MVLYVKCVQIDKCNKQYKEYYFQSLLLQSSHSGKQLWIKSEYVDLEISTLLYLLLLKVVGQDSQDDG